MPRFSPFAAGLITAAMLFAAPGNAALPVGAKAPEIRTAASVGGNEFSFVLSRALKTGPVVLYFFPKVFTRGCTVEAHEFALAAAKFEKQGATLIGLSADDIGGLKRFSKEACRDAFPVGVASADTIRKYDVALGKTTLANRTSYVIAPGGKIIYSLTQDDPIGHVQGTMKAVKVWEAAHRRRG